VEGENKVGERKGKKRNKKKEKRERTEESNRKGWETERAGGMENEGYKKEK